jgi:hypothetical protein
MVRAFVQRVNAKFVDPIALAADGMVRDDLTAPVQWVLKVS